MAIKYKIGGIGVTIDGKAVVELPPRVFRARLIGTLFEFDKTFLVPPAVAAVRGAVAFFADRKGKEVLVVGHSDRSGNPDHHLFLSVERAEALAAFMQDDVDGWLRFYRSGARSLRWGAREDQLMLSALSDGDGPFYEGPPGQAGSEAAMTAVRRFQKESGFPQDGVVSEPTRRKLIERYMQQEGSTLPKGTSVAVHGCGESHPMAARPAGVEHPRNRRFEVFVFEKSVEPAPRRICPAGGCAEQPQWVERSDVTEDFDSSWRAPADYLEIKLVDLDDKPVPRARYRVTTASGEVREGFLDEKGLARLDDLSAGLCKVSFPDFDGGSWDRA